MQEKSEDCMQNGHKNVTEMQIKRDRLHGAGACGAGRSCACAKTRVIRSTAAQLRYVLRYAFPKN